MILKKSKDVTVELRVVRAYMTSNEVRKQHGIFANFSAKLVINDLTYITLNDLSVRLSHAGDMFIGSNGRKLDRGYLSFISFFTGEENDGNEELKEKFVKDLSEEVKAFYRNAQNALKENKNKGFKTEVLSDWEPYEPAKDSSDKRTDDQPF